jgi:hypothetical protein
MPVMDGVLQWVCSFLMIIGIGMEKAEDFRASIAYSAGIGAVFE